MSLARALPQLDVLGNTHVRLPKAQPGTLFGKGKIEELKGMFKAAEVELVVIDGPVSPVQQRNLEKEWNVKILDRTGLILEIFSDRARTREGVLQVEMAALSYQKTRLVRAWTHLERQRGGLGFVGGPGETQIESDRRALDEAIIRIRRQLEKTVKTRELHRAARKKVPYPVVALVGYTNAGKSTFFNHLTGAKVFAKDMLFATLDPTMRAVNLPNGLDVILSDTVGFISDLPTELVAAFRATLEDALSADLILHVRDIAHPETESQAGNVRTILSSLGIGHETPQIEIWNKTDLLNEEDAGRVAALAERKEDVFGVSSITGDGMEVLLAAIKAKLDDERSTDILSLPFSAGQKRAWLFQEDVVQVEDQDENGFKLTVSWTQRQKERFDAL
ncbi:Putative GTP-binding protein [Rhodobacterales bacterium HTCC2150]|nr:Putative GTP-binding protein [Rhodobacterales bacterium HTCC2150] [Rhodobacteraceae bacterium HTCC2150]